MKRSRIKPKRATPRRRDAPRYDRQQWDEASMLLFARSRGMCEHCGEPLNGRAERHHRARRRDGGDRLANLLLLLPEHHHEITDRPESETGARAAGLVVSALSDVDPAVVPVLQWGSTWVLLDDDGHATACDAPEPCSREE